MHTGSNWKYLQFLKLTYLFRNDNCTKILGVAALTQYPNVSCTFINSSDGTNLQNSSGSVQIFKQEVMKSNLFRLVCTINTTQTNI